MPDLAEARERMVEIQLARRGIRDAGAMRRVPREAFVDGGFEEFAYQGSPARRPGVPDAYPSGI